MGLGAMTLTATALLIFMFKKTARTPMGLTLITVSPQLCSGTGIVQALGMEFHGAMLNVLPADMVAIA